MTTYRDESGPGDTTAWFYDPATGLLVQKLYDDGKGPSYTYTPDGKLAARTWARGVVTSYAYDVSGELALIQYSDGTQPILKTYNRLGNPVMIVSAGTTNTFEYSATTLEKISDTQLGYAIRYGNDNLGRMETLSITNHYDGAYAYDAFGRMGEASFEGMDFHYAYLPGSDLVKGLTYGAVAKTVAFEAQRNLVTGISYHTDDDALIAERTYTYNALGNVVARTRQRGADPVETDAFNHNLRSELIAASLGGTNAVSGDYGYAYDPIGNRVVATNRSDVTAYASNELNQYTNIISDAPFTPEFDDDGNQILVKTSTGIWHVTYNAENRPVVWSNGTAVVTMDFDRMGRRVWYKSISGAQTNAYAKFVYDGYLCVQQLDGLTGTVDQEFVWDPTETVATRPLVWHIPATNRTFFYFHDGNKNVSDVVDASDGSLAAHYDYAPFGAVTTATGPMAQTNPYRFSSEYHDTALGCVYYNYRHYNPLDGRWTTRDPIGEKGHSYLSSATSYGFVNNKIDVVIDVLGLMGFPPEPAWPKGPLGSQNSLDQVQEALDFYSKKVDDYLKCQAEGTADQKHVDRINEHFCGPSRKILDRAAKALRAPAYALSSDDRRRIEAIVSLLKDPVDKWCPPKDKLPPPQRDDWKERDKCESCPREVPGEVPNPDSAKLALLFTAFAFVLAQVINQMMQSGAY